MESESSDSADEQDIKSEGGKGVKSSSKPRSRSSETEMKTISSDSSLLMPERVDSCQTEFDVHHRDKLSGVMDIQQFMVASRPDATTKFGLTQVSTQLSKHLEQIKASPDQGCKVKLSAAQVLKELKAISMKSQKLKLTKKGLRFLKEHPILIKRNWKLTIVKR